MYKESFVQLYLFYALSLVLIGLLRHSLYDIILSRLIVFVNIYFTANLKGVVLMSKEILNPLESAQKQVKDACDALGLEPSV